MTNINGSIKRKNNTDLSDNELVLFDVLFDGNIPIESLVDGSSFSIKYNCHGHTLDNKQFVETINCLRSKGYIECIFESSDPVSSKICTYIGLTQKGGGVWEKERNPDWEKYIFDLYNYEEDGSVNVFIFSPSFNTAQHYLKTITKSNLLKISPSIQIIENEVKGESFNYIPWKLFSNMYEIKIPFKKGEYADNQQNVDWEYYKKHKIWWKNIKDLLVYF